MEPLDRTERVETAIIGGGQAGLATAYYLKERGRPFVILDAGDRIGDAWRASWESLRLFTPARFDSLPGFPFPASSWSFPTKDEMADYLEAYVERFDLPVRTGVKIQRLEKQGGRFVITSSRGRFEAVNVVVATGACQNPKAPGFAGQLRPDITQLHSKDYLSPSQLTAGDVLVVGVGNSGAEISMELSATRHTLLAGKESGHIPTRHGSLTYRPWFRVFRFVGHRVLTRGTPIGRKLAPKLFAHGDPLIRVRPRDLAAAGIERVPRVAGIKNGLPLLDDGRIVDGLAIVSQDRQVDPSEVRSEPRAPDDVRHVQNPAVLEQRQTVLDSGDPGDPFDTGGGEVLRPDPDQRIAVAEQLRSELASDRVPSRQHAVADEPEDPEPGP